jgi:hypothetical protein
MAVMSLISMKSFGCADIKMKWFIEEMAKSSSKSIAGFETLQAQMDFLSKAFWCGGDNNVTESNDDTTKRGSKLYSRKPSREIYKDITAQKGVMNEKLEKYY